jgi:hypothetical protein
MRIYMISSLGSGSHCMGIVKSFENVGSCGSPAAIFESLPF